METPPQQVSEDEEPVTFSFYTDISANPQVIKTALIINQSIHRSFGGIGKFLEGWKRYKLLWKLDKVSCFSQLSIIIYSLTPTGTSLATICGQEAICCSVRREAWLVF